MKYYVVYGNDGHIVALSPAELLSPVVPNGPVLRSQPVAQDGQSIAEIELPEFHRVSDLVAIATDQRLDTQSGRVQLVPKSK